MCIRDRSNNTIKPEELPKLIAKVFGALDSAGSTPAPQEELTPAVPIRGSVKKTNRVVVAEEGWYWASVGSTIADFISRDCFDWLDAPVERVCQADVPMPYAFNLEAASLPNAQDIVAAVKRACYVK